ncbi:branched-chain amino acid aminotransferase II [Pleurotus eryngii]|uniref:Branched-chain-amino-acid aminotransferase n=1 Tax=Pleurotus eryngii TaxID=5323 RepID=A0A9P6DJ27_PLEER|nr:branched-chain amino acid aminotransferase II [Pleurotus eryngii]
MSSMLRSIHIVGNIARRAFRPIYGTRLMSAYVDPLSGQPAELPDIQHGRLIIDKNEQPTPPPPSETLVFGRTFTDHMLTIEWSATNGWEAPHIKPYGPLNLAPSSSVLHYAQTLFEGMKAYRTDDDRIQLFRPDMNMKRMNNSARRIALPTFNGDSLLELIKKLIRMDRHWVPKEPGHSLYIRPTLIASQQAIQVSPPTEAILFVICSPVGPYFPKPVSLYATTEYIRAAPGGTGAFKLGVNYAPAVMPQKMVAEKGYSQNLWLHGPEHYLTEVGTMNMFVVLKKDDGDLEIVTPPLDGMILPGITRDSVLQLLRDHISGTRPIRGLDKGEKLAVSERGITMKEVKDASQTGKLVELFGAGTAAIISPVHKIGYLNEDIEIPTGPDGMGRIARAVRKELSDIQWGKISHPWSVPVDE